jgi:DNA-binding protein HU-beta
VNKGSLVSEIVKRTDLRPRDVSAVVDSLIEVVRDRVARGERVVLSGFGSFERVRRNARTGRNPHTREAVKIPARTVPWFRPGMAFREAVAAKRRSRARRTARR